MSDGTTGVAVVGLELAAGLHPIAPPVNWNMPRMLAHGSAMRGGTPEDVPAAG